ncbi:TatD family hydrolase [Patescibacteria group bacterium]|nr:TatD family hydrolase [Patescibacteria group bacterium]MBU1612957.1 TatD family hydrolase [Patescibacteria group bacterium]
MIDSHCHIQFNAYKDDADEVIKRCREKNVTMNCVGSQRDTSVRAVEYAEKYDSIFATVGLHPVHISSTEVDEEEIRFQSREEGFDYEFYKKLASHPKVIGIGECGLELFHLPPNINREEVITKQTVGFMAQYNLAKELRLPMVIHVRDAHQEMIELLSVIARSEGRATKQSLKIKITAPHHHGECSTIAGVVHCFTGNWQFAQEYLKLGLYIGFTGVITFPAKKTDPKSQEELLEVVKNCPRDRILIETDAPYLAPQAYRGKRCEPWMVVEVAKKIAEIRGLSLEEVVKLTEENTRRLFYKINI